MKEPRISPCCGLIVVLESIYLNVRRSDGTMGRKTIGEVARCSSVKCEKIVGEVRSFGVPAITGPAWSMMLRYHKGAPYYFNLTPYGLVPETAPQDAIKKPYEVVALGGQDRATEEHDPREDEA